MALGEGFANTAKSPASWQGEPPGCLVSQHMGLGIYCHLLSHLWVTREGKKELGQKGGKLNLTLTQTQTNGSFPSPRSLRNNRVQVRRELGHTPSHESRPHHCGAAQSRPQRGNLLTPSQLSQKTVLQGCSQS